MTLATVNAVMAGAIFFVTIGSITCMNGVTCNAVRGSMIFILAGSLGQMLGHWTGQWGPYLDTVLYGGLLAFLVANKRSGKSIPSWLSPVLSFGVLVLTLIVVIVYYRLNS